jgi:hypothetical protein
MYRVLVEDRSHIADQFPPVPTLDAARGQVLERAADRRHWDAMEIVKERWGDELVIAWITHCPECEGPTEVRSVDGAIRRRCLKCGNETA